MKRKNNGGTFSFEQIRKAAILYMALPLLCFFCGFLRWYYMLLCCGVLALVVWRILAGYQEENDKVLDADKKFPEYTLKTVLAVFGVSLLWTYLGGMNGYFYQSWDWAWRNAVYFDLIEFDWPVIYPQTGSALVYYFGHWLPPAILAKGVQALAGSMEAGRIAGRFLLWLWSSMGLTIIILMLFHVLKAMTHGTRIAAVLLFVFFSGMDLIGAIGVGNIGHLLDPAVTNWQQFHLERWCQGYEFSSVTTCVFWVFNQAIIPWMITLCFLTEEHPKNYVYYGVVCLLCGTLPCVGLAILMIARVAVYGLKSLKRREIRTYFAKVFSLQNLVSFFVLFPVVAVFILSCNTSRYITGSNENNLAGIHLIVSAQAEKAAEEDIAGNQEAAEENEVTIQPETENESIWSSIFSKKYLNLKLLQFLFLEVGCYMLLIWHDHRKNILFYVIGFGFLFIPYFHIGESNDFCMRVTMPGLFILMVYVSRFLFDHFPTKRNQDKQTGKVRHVQQAAAIVLAVCFLIGAATPMVEIYRGIYNVAKNRTIFLEDQRIMTFRDRVPDNFACSNPGDHFFFQTLAR